MSISGCPGKKEKMKKSFARFKNKLAQYDPCVNLFKIPQILLIRRKTRPSEGIHCVFFLVVYGILSVPCSLVIACLEKIDLLALWFDMFS